MSEPFRGRRYQARVRQYQVKNLQYEYLKGILGVIKDQIDEIADKVSGEGVDCLYVEATDEDAGRTDLCIRVGSEVLYQMQCFSDRGDGPETLINFLSKGLKAWVGSDGHVFVTGKRNTIIGVWWGDGVLDRPPHPQSEGVG